MKIDIEKEALGDVGLNQMGLNVNSLTFKTLIDGIYNNKLGAVIREISSNARDAHIKSENTDPFEIILDTNNSNLVTKMTIKDYGNGLTKEEMIKYLCTLNSSSKRDSNDFIGFLGIGSKSPFSLVNNYNFTSYKDNNKIVLNFFRADNETPHYDIVTEPSDVNVNSVECNIIFYNQTIPVQDTLSEIYKQLILFDIQPRIIVNNIEENKTEIYEPENFFSKVTETEHYFKLSRDDSPYYENLHRKYTSCNLLISLGNVIYQYKISNYYNVRSTSSDTYIFKFDPQELSFNEGREFIVDVPANFEKIRNKLNSIFQELPTVHLCKLNETYFEDFRDYARKKTSVSNVKGTPKYDLKNDIEMVHDVLAFLIYSSMSFLNNRVSVELFDFNLSLLQTFLRVIKLHVTLNQLEYPSLIDPNIFLAGFKKYYYINNIETKLEKINYLYLTSSTLNIYFDALQIKKLLAKNTALVIITTNKHDTYDAILNNFNTLVKYLPESKMFTALTFKKVYNDIYNLIRKPVKPKAVATSSEPVVKKTISSEGYPIGKKLDFTYCLKDQKVNVNKTYVEFAKMIDKGLNSYYKGMYVLITKNIVSTEEEKNIVLKSIGSNNFDYYKFRFVFEIDNLDGFNNLIEFFTIYYSSKSPDTSRIYIVLDNNFEIDYTEYKHLFLNYYVSINMRKNLLDFIAKIPKNLHQQKTLFSYTLNNMSPNISRISFILLLSLINNELYLRNEYVDLIHYSYYTMEHYSNFSTLFNNAEEDLNNLFIKKYNFENFNLEFSEEAKQLTPEINYESLWEKFYPESPLLEEE